MCLIIKEEGELYRNCGMGIKGKPAEDVVTGIGRYVIYD